jgi:hypothetical protein
VRNQVESIRKASNPDWWRHCRIQNPADLASRGAPAPALVHSNLWWNGPTWLSRKENEWPDSPETEDKIQEEIEAEANGKIVSVAAVIIDPVQPIEWHLDKISKWQKLLRRTAWILRFINRIRKREWIPQEEILQEVIPVNGKEITVDQMTVSELHEAEILIYRQLQRDRYPKSFNSLQANLPIHCKEKIALLNPIWDERDKLIRIGGRIALALSDRETEPIILLPVIMLSFLFSL